ncbi:MAG: hypothetical protein ACSHWQ_04675 [Spongiibacteraceae bacterium]
MLEKKSAILQNGFERFGLRELASIRQLANKFLNYFIESGGVPLTMSVANTGNKMVDRLLLGENFSEYRRKRRRGFSHYLQDWSILWIYATMLQ